MTDLSPDERELCDKLVRRIRQIKEGHGEVTFTVRVVKHKPVLLRLRNAEAGFTVEETEKI
jgi:hypothetical protein